MSQYTPEISQAEPIPTHFISLKKNAKDLTGHRFGRLIAMGPSEKRNRRTMWLCICDCGSHIVVDRSNLHGGLTQSCGCLHAERTSEARKTHGFSGTHLYGVWRQIINRCTIATNKAYGNYGGRGISICNEWRHNFRAFYDHVSMLPNYGEKGYSLDRINNDGNYEPGNVRWATRLEQNRNKRKR